MLLSFWAGIDGYLGGCFVVERGMHMVAAYGSRCAGFCYHDSRARRAWR